MTEPQVFMVAGSALVVTQGVMSLGVGLLRDYLSGNKKVNGHSYCSDHLKLQASIDNLVAAHKDEKRVEVMAKAFTLALKESSKKK